MQWYITSLVLDRNHSAVTRCMMRYTLQRKRSVCTDPICSFSVYNKKYRDSSINSISGTSRSIRRYYVQLLRGRHRDTLLTFISVFTAVFRGHKSRLYFTKSKKKCSSNNIRLAVIKIYFFNTCFGETLRVGI